MTSAFDWSPGGCCCKVPGGLFDHFYGASNYGGANTFDRQGSFTPPGTTPPVDSSSKGWQIQHGMPDPTAVREYIGYSRDGRIVWTWAMKQLTINGLPEWFECMDTNTQTTKFVFTPSRVRRTGSGFVSHDLRYNNMAIGHDKIAFVGGPVDDSSNRRVSIIDTADNLEEWTLGAPAQQFGIGLPVNTGLSGTTSYLLSLARLDWPWCVGIRGNTFAGGIVNPEFIVFQSTAPQGGSTSIQATSVEVINSTRPVTGANPSSVLAFDSHDGYWASLTMVEVPGGFGGQVGRRWCELHIAGQSKWIRELPSGEIPNRNVHVCYPHETLGGGYVAVLETDQSTNYTVIYKNGAEVWRSIPGGGAGFFYGSTDRWIYMQTADINVSLMTGGKFTGLVNPNARFWALKHDGSEIIPLGILSNTKFSVQPTGNYLFNLTTQVIESGFFARNSALPLSLPGTYDEIYDGRNG